MKTVIDIINALTSLGIVGFLIYFFIYYRKPMRSVLNAIGDTDSLKAGPLEYKRRKQDLNKALAHFKNMFHKESEISTSQERIILDLEEECLLLSTLFLAVTHTADVELKPPEMLEWLKDNRDEHYKKVKSKKPNSKTIALCDSMVSNLDFFPPIDDSLQSKP